MEPRAGSRAVPVIYGAAIFVSAFLLFQVEPIMGKLILPWFGGSAAVWTTSVLFFQLTLLAGYAYAHLSVRFLRPGWQAAVHGALILASLALLPILPSASWKPSPAQDPTLRILGLLSVTVGLPFLLLSTTGPLLQAWYARRRGAGTYRLFALSNGASVLGLVSYPLIVEPLLATHRQAEDWSIGYLVFAALIAAVALPAGRSAAPLRDADEGASPPPSPGMVPAAWLMLAACPSLLFLAITNELSQNIAPIPFLWVLPLTLYLISFVLCFEGRRWYRRALFLPLLPLALLAMAYLLSPYAPDTTVGVLIAVFAGGLFVCCMVCHGELSRLRPAPHRLTLFYLMLSLGGALGGLFVAVVAPHVFSGYFELPFGLEICAVLVIGTLAPGLWRARTRRRVQAPAVLVAAALGALGLGWLLLAGVGDYASGTRVVTRDFYGALVVLDDGTPDDPTATRDLTNGTVDHGDQFLAAARRRIPTTYYGRRSGIGLLLGAERPAPALRVGVIGLGAGTLAAYGRRGDSYRFYEIDPQDVTIARTQFSFLRDSPAPVRIVLGDARRSLESEPPQHFDVLAADAFTGDSVPIHLLTKQAFELYFRHLKPDGVLAVHVSNDFLDLAPTVARTAATIGKTTVLIQSTDDTATDAYASDWVLVSSNQTLIARLAHIGHGSLQTGTGLRAWDDNYSDLLQTL
jgi:hypothetical protein